MDHVLDFIAEHELAFTVLKGNHPVSDGLESLLTDIPHARIVPFSEPESRENDVIVLNSRDMDDRITIKDNSSQNLIFRVDRRDLKRLNRMVKDLAGGYQRINIHLLDQNHMDEDDIVIYRDELAAMAEWIRAEYRKGNALELNALSDRMLLREMNNCGAGVDHLTLAPNGQFYICPGFFHDTPGQPVGSLENGINIINGQLFQLEYAPVCRICDAYQCKRCVYLNLKATMEVNTPSYQQCTLSHLERDESRRMLEDLRDIHELSELPGIPELDYMDPLIVLRERQRIPTKPKPLEPPVKKDAGELPPLGELRPEAWGPSNHNNNNLAGVLGEILSVQKEILSLLKKRGEEHK